MFINDDFPRIECLNDILPHIAHLPEIRLNVHENGFSTLCYMISKHDTFSGEHAAFARECRGITFYPDGKIASRTIDKFFNVNERESTQRNVLPWDMVIRIMSKLDGSMITPVLVDGKILLKSKKSFTSDVALLAQEYINDKPGYIAFCKELLMNDMTPTFEFTSPKARIVLNYKTDALTLLHIRHNASGAYVSIDILEAMARPFRVPVVEDYPITENMDYYFDSVEHDTDIEGYVIQFKSGLMVKLKTKWYLQLHRNVVFLNERDIAEMVLSETLDDYKSYLNETDSQISIKNVEAIENIVCDAITQVEIDVEQMVNENKHLDKKGFAMALKHNPIFYLAMKLYEGKEPDYKEWYRKRKLKQTFTSTQV